MAPAIILINGTSSTGKTSTAKTLQKIFPGPLMYLGLDPWIRETLSDRFWEPALTLEERHTEPEALLGTHFLLPNTPKNPLPWPSVGSGVISDAAIDAMYQTAIYFYQRGFWVIIDHVFLTSLWRDHFLEMTSDYQRFLIKFTCHETILMEREKRRANRLPDLYKALEATIHQGVPYDLTIDTSYMTVNEAAQQILNFTGIQTSCNN